MSENGEWIRIFQANDGRSVRIELDDDGYCVTAYRADDGQEIGCMEIDLDEDGGHFRLVWAYLNKIDSSYTHQGIGRAMLSFHHKRIGLRIDAAEHVRGVPLIRDSPSFEGVDDGGERFGEFH